MTALALGAAEGEECSCLEGRLERFWQTSSAAAETVDAMTGKDLRNFPPDRVVDFDHMRLDIAIPDMNTRRLEATQRLTLAPISTPVHALTLNAKFLHITSAALEGRGDVPFTSDEEHVTYTFDPPIVAGESVTLVTDYVVEDPIDGLFWLTEAPEWPGRPAQIHTQGESDTNSFWFPCHDFPNERLTTELVVTVPKGYEVSSNGVLVDQSSSGGASTFHWSMDKPHVNYLVSLIVGKFAVVDVAPSGARVKLPVYAAEQFRDRIKPSYGKTHDMIQVFERRLDEPYPWQDRYAQLCVWNFGAGGMENTGATTMYDIAVFDEIGLEDGDLEGLISHELGHQWFGDLITCNSWEHIWLNEGWATYMESLWFEASRGYQDGYLWDIYGACRGLPERDQVRSERDITRPGMVSNVYESPDEVFRKPSNPYPKGCAILHMLRNKLGEETFFKGVALYLDRFKFSTAETDDFRKCLEEVSGKSLEQFFAQWAYAPGTPKMAIKARWDANDQALNITAEQKQYIGDGAPAFVFDLPVWVYANDSSSPQVVIMNIDGRRHEHALTLDAEPSMVVIDPELTVAMALDVDLPESWLIAQLHNKDLHVARRDAAKYLQDKKSSASTEALVACVLDDGEHYTIRREAAASLGEMGKVDELAEMLASGVANPRVRDAVIDALGQESHDLSSSQIDLLRWHAAEQERSYACRSSALAALGYFGAERDMPLYEAAIHFDSNRDTVREGALRGLGRLDLKEGLPLAIELTRFGVYNRTRSSALRTVGNLAHHDQKLAFDAVAPLLNDTEGRAVRGAINALVDCEQEDGLALLRGFADRTRDEGLADQARRAAGRLGAALPDRDELVERVRKLEEMVEKLTKDGGGGAGGAPGGPAGRRGRGAPN
ncbi:MAG: hypothetical protein KDA20_05090 [Phycisphaerales bacterium]|nr:hypothetical protein [Phycisphaerales bacterium]